MAARHTIPAHAGVLGLLRARITTPDPDAVTVRGMTMRGDWTRARDGLWRSPEFRRTNAYVNQGLQRALDRFFGIGGPPAAPSHIGVSSDNIAVTAATTALGGIERFAAFGGATPSRTGNVVTAQATFTPGAGAGQVDFAIRKIGLSVGALTGNAMDIIGGAGVSPYNEPLTLDLTGTSGFTLVLAIDTEFVAV